MTNEDAVKMCSTKYLVSGMSMELKTDELTDDQQYLLLGGSHPMKKDIGLFYFNGYPSSITDDSIEGNQLFPYSAVTRVEYSDMEWEVGDGSDTSLDPFPTDTLISENTVTFNVSGFSNDTSSIQINVKNGTSYFALSNYGLYFKIANTVIDSDGNGTIDITFGIGNAKTLDGLVLTPNSSDETIYLPVKICGKGKNGHLACTENYSIIIDNSKRSFEKNPHGKLIFKSTDVTIESEGTSISFTYEHIKIDASANLSGFTFDSGDLEVETSIVVNGDNNSGSGYITLKPNKITSTYFNLKVSAVEQYYTTSVSVLLHISVN